MSIVSPSPFDPDLVLDLPRLSIPKDQEHLLTQESSWASPAPHVPDHVLETLAEAYKNSAKNTSLGASKQSDKHPSQANGSVSTHNALNGRDTSPRPSPKQSASLKSSPRRENRTASPQHQSPIPSSAIVCETPRPAPNGTSTPRNFVTSTARSEIEELETEIPQAFASVDPPVNRAALPSISASTSKSTDAVGSPQPPPPCAQPNEVVPGTLTNESDSSSRPSARDPRSKIQKPIVFERTVSKPRSLPDSSRRMPKLSKYQEISGSNSTTPSITAVVPATCSAVAPTPIAPASAVTAAVSHEPAVTASDPIDATYNGASGTGIAQKPCAEQIDGPAPTKIQMGSQISTQQQSPRPVGCEVQLNSYERFTQTYPDYVIDHGGSLKYFVEACVCIEYLKKEWLLRECLYDEFIRAFSGGYVLYVSRAGSRKPLPALEWFNNQPGVSLYNRMVVTKSELDFILKSFPAQVEAARRAVKTVKTDVVEKRDEPLKQSDKQPDKQPDEQPDEQPDKQPDEHPDEQPDKQPDEHPDEQLVEQPDEQLDEQPCPDPRRHAEEQPEKQKEQSISRSERVSEQEPSKRPDMDAQNETRNAPQEPPRRDRLSSSVGVNQAATSRRRSAPSETTRPKESYSSHCSSAKKPVPLTPCVANTKAQVSQPPSSPELGSATVQVQTPMPTALQARKRSRVSAEWQSLGSKGHRTPEEKEGLRRKFRKFKSSKSSTRADWTPGRNT